MNTHIKKILAISLCLVMCLSALPMLAPSASAAPVAVSNDASGEIVILHQDYRTTYSVPNNIFMALERIPQVVTNSTLTYDHVYNAVKGQWTPGNKGSIYIGGLAPAVTATYELTLSVGTSHQNQQVYIKGANAYLAVTPRGDGTVRVSSFYWDGSAQVSEIISVPDALESTLQSVPLHISISYDGVSKTNTITVNGQSMTTPFRYGYGEPYTAIGSTVLSFSGYTGEHGPMELKLYEFKQTMPRSSLVTAISDPAAVPVGFDYPFDRNAVERGIGLISEAGGVGTIWVDVTKNTNESNVAKIKALLAQGWELGIHYSKRLTDLEMDDAIALMNAEYATVIDQYGQAPRTWCSLQNADNESHAAHAYNHLGMVWRNGYGRGQTTNIGNIHNGTWNWWEAASRAGAFIPVFTHATDEEPAVQYSIDYSKWEEFVDNIVSSGGRFVSHYDYWCMAQNTYHTQVTDLSIENGKSMSFTIDNIGGKSRLYVAAPWTETVRDSAGNEVPFEQVDGGIIIEVEAGEYVLSSEPIKATNALGQYAWLIVAAVGVIALVVYATGVRHPVVLIVGIALVVIAALLKYGVI